MFRTMGRDAARSLLRIKPAHDAYQSWQIARHVSRIRGLEDLARGLGHQLLDQSELTRPAGPEKRTCHVIGSGWSLEDSLALARSPEAYVLGFNFACLSGLRFDEYFIEFGGPTCKEIAYAQRAAIDWAGDSLPERIYFKNLWEPKNELEWAADLYGDRIRFIKDLRIQCVHARSLRRTTKLLLTDDSVHLRQYVSSALTMIVHARNLGFTQIVLHGVDFGGDYFFDLPAFESIEHLRPPTSSTIAYSTSTRSGGAHATNRPRTGVEQVMPILRDALAEDGISLTSASARSPLSLILPLHEPQ